MTFELTLSLNVRLFLTLNYFQSPAWTPTLSFWANTNYKYFKLSSDLEMVLYKRAKRKTNPREMYMASPVQVGLSHGGRWGCTAPGSASGSYPERTREDVSNAYGAFYQRVNKYDSFLVGSHPLFHDVVGMIGHLFHYFKSSWVDRNVKSCTSHIWETVFTFHWQHVQRPWVYLVCLCSRVILQTGFLDSLKHNKRRFRARGNRRNNVIYCFTSAQCCTGHSWHVIWS